MKSDKFPPTSRYHDVEVATVDGPDGRPVKYLRRRFVPDPSTFSTLSEHTVRQGERLDQIAAAAIGDPEAFWRIADANGARAPEELTRTAGRRVRIALPAGVPAREPE